MESPPVVIGPGGLGFRAPGSASTPTPASALSTLSTPGSASTPTPASTLSTPGSASTPTPASTLSTPGSASTLSTLGISAVITVIMVPCYITEICNIYVVL